MADVFMTEKLKHLKERGLLETAAGASSDFFKDLVKQCKKEFPEVKFIARAAHHGIGEFIYLPKARNEVMSIMKNCLYEHEKIAKRLTVAIAKLEKQ